MSDRPEQRPEGRLIALAQKRARISQREAAKRAGISEARWRNIVSGYQTISAGVYAPVRGPADTVARMAQAVDVTAEQLTAADRADAAEVLQFLTDADMPPLPPVEPSDDELDAMIEAAREDRVLYEAFLSVWRLRNPRARGLPDQTDTGTADSDTA